MHPKEKNSTFNTVRTAATGRLYSTFIVGRTTRVRAQKSRQVLARFSRCFYCWKIRTAGYCTVQQIWAQKSRPYCWFFCCTSPYRHRKRDNKAWHRNRGGVGQICEISTVIFNAEKIVVVNSDIFPASSIKESLLDWFSLRGFSRGIAQKFLCQMCE
jgi:hypothetical protein